MEDILEVQPEIILCEGLNVSGLQITSYPEFFIAGFIVTFIQDFFVMQHVSLDSFVCKIKFRKLLK